MTRGQRAGGGEGKRSVRVGGVGTARAGALRLDGAAGGHRRGGGARRTVPERDAGQGRTRGRGGFGATRDPAFFSQWQTDAKRAPTSPDP